MALSISRASIRRPVAVWLAIIFCLVGGYWGLNTVGRLEDPSFTLNLSNDSSGALMRRSR